MNTSVRLYSLKVTDYKSYLFASLFVLGNILLPRLFHFLPAGGSVFLPILFFTLIAAYKYGYTTGLITAMASPVVNHLLFGMPDNQMLLSVLVKSVLLAVFAGLIARRSQSVKFTHLVGVVLSYQITAAIVLGLLSSNFGASFYGIIVGLPGILLQIVGGFLVLNSIKGR